jgi:aminoglycoside 6'-N-acetyltransferase I
MSISIRTPARDDRAEWLRMRHALWDDCSLEELEQEIVEILEGNAEAIFLAERPEGRLCGFLEASIHLSAIGCGDGPVGYIEGWYVDPDVRRQQVGRALVESAEACARSKGCAQMASDAKLWNSVSHQAHGALGYNEVARLVLFKKDLGR